MINKINILANSKLENADALYRKGDKKGACRDINIVYYLNREANLLETVTYAGYSDSRAAGIDRLKTELSLARREFEDVVITLRDNYYCN